MAKTGRYRLFDVSTGASAAFDGADGRFAPADDGPAGTERLVALVPADRCSLVRVDLPEMSGARMAKALRWAVEDSIAGDPEAQHVVPLRRGADGRLLCLVVARADMHRWLEALPGQPERMVPDAACLPRADDEVVGMQSGDRVLVGAGEAGFDRIEAELLDSMLPEFVSMLGAEAKTIWLGDTPPDELRRFDPELRPAPVSPLETLAPRALGESGRLVNLVHGEYGRRDDAPSHQQWRRMAWLGGLAGALLVAGAVADYAVLKREHSRVEQAVEDRFAELFPGISTVVRPRAQAERALAGLRGGGRDRFVALMSAVSPLFGGAQGVRVDTLDYAEGRVDLELEAPSLEDLEALQRQLRAQGLDVALRDLAVQPRRTRGRLRISEAGE